MIQAERRERIQKEIAANGFISINKLAERLNISLSTVRRDLIDLEEEGLVVRSRGGASLAGHELVLEAVASSRAVQHTEEKIRIAEKAVDLVSEAGCIILDSGTTTLEIAKRLKPQQSLRVITDSVEIAYELRDRDNVSVLVTGGLLKPGSYNMYGGFAEHMLQSMHAQICVMGAIGISIREGLTKHAIEALPLRRKMVEISRRLICVADSSKINVTGLVSVCPIASVDILVTDDGIEPDVRAEFEDAGVEVIVV